jgi:hypothetical protein
MRLLFDADACVDRHFTASPTIRSRRSSGAALLKSRRALSVVVGGQQDGLPGLFAAECGLEFGEGGGIDRVPSTPY